MKVKYFAALAIASLVTVGTAHLAFTPQIVRANPCASNPCAANPCAANPCAGNPCAGKNPCAANPCAGNPCAGKNPCAANPCAGNPCAGKNPCAANPCAANPCAGNPCAGKNPCAGANPCAAAAAPAPQIYTDPAAGNNLAIRGYDPVAYFTERRPVEGSSRYQYRWKGAIWQFSSARNMELFKASPGEYAPQYGGYCAKALSDGNLASIVPDAWAIVDGKLYLNYSAEAQNEWLTDVPGKIARADANWPGILNTAGVIYYDTVGAVRL